MTIYRRASFRAIDGVVIRHMVGNVVIPQCYSGLLGDAVISHQRLSQSLDPRLFPDTSRNARLCGVLSKAAPKGRSATIRNCEFEPPWKDRRSEIWPWSPTEHSDMMIAVPNPMIKQAFLIVLHGVIPMPLEGGVKNVPSRLSLVG